MRDSDCIIETGISMNSGEFFALLAFIILTGALVFSGCMDSGVQGPGAIKSTTGMGVSTDWNLTIAGDRTIVYNLEEIRAMPAVTLNGFAVSTVGIKYGPYICRGVPLRYLAGLAGTLNPQDQVWVSAPDGYLWVFDRDQIDGKGFVTFNESLQEIPSPPLTILLMYEQDGHPLSNEEGGPARIAICSAEKGVVTEGSAWVKWVHRIELHRK